METAVLGRDSLPTDWSAALAPALAAPRAKELADFLQRERRDRSIYPPEDQVFRALRLTPLKQVRVVLLGQDPYHRAGQANGLCFSVAPTVKLPPSLKNIYHELADDLGQPPPPDGDLQAWARQGVLLLNTVLTVAEGEPLSHRQQGWEEITDAAISAVSKHNVNVVFLLWGKPAQQKKSLIELDKHVVLASAHPSPLSARRGFFGSKPFSRTNAHLQARGYPPIQW